MASWADFLMHMARDGPLPWAPLYTPSDLWWPLLPTSHASFHVQVPDSDARHLGTINLCSCKELSLVLALACCKCWSRVIISANTCLTASIPCLEVFPLILPAWGRLQWELHRPALVYVPFLFLISVISNSLAQNRSVGLFSPSCCAASFRVWVLLGESV